MKAASVALERAELFSTAAAITKAMPRAKASVRSTSRTKTERKQQPTPALDALIAAGTQAAKHRKGRAKDTRNRDTSIQAPITAEIEGQLAALIRQFGAAKVREALTPLVTKCKWNDWLCVSHAVDRLAQRG